MSGLTRREALAAAAASGAAYLLSRGTASAAVSTRPRLLDLAARRGLGTAAGPASGVANFRRVAGEGLLEAGSDVFPNDPRPVAFAVDRRFRDGTIRATITRTGDGPGVVLRRVGPRAYYAAIYDRERSALILVRREGTDLHELASAPAPLVATPLTLSLRAVGRSPTLLEGDASIRRRRGAGHGERLGRRAAAGRRPRRARHLADPAAERQPRLSRARQPAPAPVLRAGGAGRARDPGGRGLPRSDQRALDGRVQPRSS